MVKFKVQTNRQYIDVLRRGSGGGSSSMNHIGPNQLLLNVQVIGIGPTFTLRVDLKNTDKSKCVGHLLVVVFYDSSFYRIRRPLLRIPALVPLLSYKYNVKIQCVEPNGNAKPLRLAICQDLAPNARSKGTAPQKGQFPVMTAIVDMPFSDVDI